MLFVEGVGRHTLDLDLVAPVATGSVVGFGKQGGLGAGGHRNASKPRIEVVDEGVAGPDLVP